MEKAAPPTAMPVAGNYTTQKSVTLVTTTPEADIYYTLDGTTPTIGSTLYINPIAVSDSLTIKAISVKQGMDNSAVLTASYTIEPSGPGEGGNTFNVASNDDWDKAVTTISAGGNDKTYVINITGDFSVDGYSSSTFGEVTGLQVSISGDKSVSLGIIGNPILSIGASQTIIVKDVDFKGKDSNSNPLISLGGNFTLNGSASVSGNKKVATASSGGIDGGGVYVGRSARECSRYVKGYKYRQEK